MIGFIKNLILNFFALISSKKNFFKQSITYSSQWESKKLVEDFVSRKKLARQDPNWKCSGAESKIEYEFWTHHICGTACLKMILDSNGIKKRIFDLVRDLKKIGAYKAKKVKLDRNYQTDVSHVDGLFYKQFCNYVVKNYPFKANVVSPMTLNRIIWEISRENYVIASVHPSIRTYRKSLANNAGGHLVIVNGYDSKKKVLIINNPSGFYPDSQHDCTIPFSDFERFFSGRGMVIKKILSDLLS